MNDDILDLIRCPTTGTSLEVEAFERYPNGAIRYGRLHSPAVSSTSADWYRIEEGLLDLRTGGLRPWDRHAEFASRFGLPRITPPADAGRGEHEQQHGQIAFFREESKVYDRTILQLPYFIASDKVCLARWISTLGKEKRILDIGGGTGRPSLPLARTGRTVVTLDLSEEMLRVASRKAAEEGLGSRTNYIVGNAARLPFVDEAFDAVVAYGSLHHIAAPEATVREAGRVLKTNGRWLSYDPHDSHARFLFELASKIRKLYNEEANEDPLFRESRLRGWLEQAGIRVEIRYHTFLLPHFFDWLSERWGHRLLELSDRIGNLLPGVRRLGGIIVAEGRRA